MVPIKGERGETVPHAEPANDVSLDDICKVIDMVAVPTLVFDGSEIIALNVQCQRLLGLGGVLPSDTLPLHGLWVQAGETGEASGEGQLVRDGAKDTYLECWCRSITVEDKRVALIHLLDVTAQRNTERQLRRLSRLRELMLEVTQAVLGVEDFKYVCQLILQKALQAIEKASIGSVLLLEGDYFVFGAGAGYKDDLANFKVPVKESFLYRATDGKMDRVVNVPDLSVIDALYFVETLNQGSKYICSTIIAPIYVKGELIGCASVDSVELAAFDHEDMQSMIFVRENIEIAVANRFLYQEKTYLAKHDQLTGLNNRWCFEEQCAAVLERARRYKEGFNLVLFDVDGLKQINDTHGHLVGDAVLKRIAATLRAHMRKSDLCARYGGDEFIGLFFHTTAEALQEKFLQHLASSTTPLQLDSGAAVPCSYSFGIATFPDDGDCIEELIRVADSRMYVAKGL